MRNRHVVLTVLCVTAGLSQASVAVPPSRTDGPSAEEAAAEEPPDYEAMIDALANRNPAPELIKLRRPAKAHEVYWFDRQPLFPADYDWEEQSRARKARAKLFAVKDPALWDHFIKHLDDDRYSLTLGQEPNFSSNKTVGDWCWDGFFARTRFARVVTKQERGAQGNAFSLDLGFIILEWREQHPKTPLYELQIALCERSLEAIPQESRLSYEARDRNSKRIQGYLDEIRRTKKPFFFSPSIDGYRLYDTEIAKAIREKYELQNAGKRRNLKKKEDEDDDPIEADRARERAKEKKKEKRERDGEGKQG
jgi:hypothetical protein